MLTSKEAKNNANNHSLQACQSGTWRKSNSGSTVITGRIANGQQIPLPTGFSASQCSWSVSNAENPQVGSRITLQDQLQLMMQIELLNVVFMMNTISIKGHLELI
ncbi:hypothetical protein [Escherichia coli]|uniref:hypothetical protein n=1 Tax=Escherichia coli TaxID=562 RepID=UPI001CED9FE9|nr:hypothetical protein [Escherichia coli]